MIKHLFAGILFLAAVAADARVINTLEDYDLYNDLHVIRIGLVGEDVWSENEAEFPDVTLSLLRQFLSRHDRAKKDPEIRRKLFKLYGQPINTPELIALRDELAAEVNARDAVYAFEFFLTNKLINDEDGTLKPAAPQLLRIEMIADYVDRYMNPLSAEEFAREKYPNSEHPLLTPREKQMASRAEINYFKVVKGYLYSDYLNCEARLVSRTGRPKLRVNSR
jgi:hypothetical protein